VGVRRSKRTQGRIEDATRRGKIQDCRNILTPMISKDKVSGSKQQSSKEHAPEEFTYVQLVEASRRRGKLEPRARIARLKRSHWVKAGV